MKKLPTITLSLLLSLNMLVFSGCDEKNSSNLEEQESYTINESSLYPEGISYDTKNKQFFVSSFNKGDISTLSRDGEYKKFTNDKKLIATTGLYIDKKRNRLLVCNSDIGVSSKSSPTTAGKLASVVEYDLTTAQRSNYFSLADLNDTTGHMANDLTMDGKGNIYVTDSFSPNIYKIDINNEVTVLATTDDWNVNSGEFGLNGIVYHPDGYLIVTHYQDASMYKVSLTEPIRIEKIAIRQDILSDTQTIMGPDGLLLVDKNTLLVVGNNITAEDSHNGAYKLTSRDNFRNVKVEKIMQLPNSFPTTMTKTENSIYLIHSKITQLLSGNSPEAKEFEIQKVKFN